MDLLTREELETIANPGTEGPHVSLFLPTHRAGRGIEGDRLRWKNLVNGVETVLLEQLRRPEAEALLQPARDLLADAMEWQYMSDGLAMYLGPDTHRSYRVPAQMTPLATVGAQPVLGPLLRLLSGDEHFLLLALSQQQVRLLEGTRNTVEQVEFVDTPTSLEEVAKPNDARSDTMARPMSSRRRGRAVFYGHGGSDTNLRQDEIIRLFRAIAGGLEDVLRAQTSPMVLVGLEQLVASYRELNTYPHLMDRAVERNVDDLSAEELHQVAWPLVEERLQQERAQVFERFQEQHGTGRVSADLRTVATAAAEGRVETLFVRADPWCWERATDDSEPIVQLGSDERYAGCALVDAAAVATLNAGGHIYATNKTAVPGSEVAAIFRY